MSRLMIALLVSAGVGLIGPVAAQTIAPRADRVPISKYSYTLATIRAEEQYTIDKEACAPLGEKAGERCDVNAKSKERIVKAEAKAAYENTPKARADLRLARAQAKFDVAIDRCDEMTGGDKDACGRKANAELVREKAKAKVDRVAAVGHRDATTERTEARADASAERREAAMKAANEKCDSVTAAAKDDCLGNAKIQ